MPPSTKPSCDHYPDIPQHRSTLLRILAEKGTPIFLGERANLIRRYQVLIKSLKNRWGPHAVSYSYKANYLVAKSGVFQECGAWAEVVSGANIDLHVNYAFRVRRSFSTVPLRPIMTCKLPSRREP